MELRGKRTILGVVGGMGPLASAEFLRTIYEHALCEQEQAAPVVLLHSDPTFPDRTTAFLEGADAPLLAQLAEALERLRAAGATRFVLCCMTIHYLVKRLPPRLRAQIIPLPDLLLAEVAQQRRPRLLLCSSGMTKLRLLQEHAEWEQAAPYVLLPSEADQQHIHRDLIYPIKSNPDVRKLFPLLESLLDQYQVDSFIVGCSEVHLLAKYYAAAGGRGGADCVDPFAMIARSLAEEYQRHARQEASAVV